MDREKCCLTIVDIFRIPVFIGWVVISTIVYSFGCVVFSFFAPPIARLIGRMWTKQLLWIGGIKIVVDGESKLDPDKRYVFVSNHQSALDIPAIIAGLKQNVSFIAKKELFMIPFFGWGLTAMGHICIDRSNPRKAIDSIKKAVSRLQKYNSSLILFPEGTRSSDGKVREFKQGSFSLALQAGVQVVPLAIRDAIERLPKKSMRIKPGTIHIQISDPIDVLPITTKAEICHKAHEVIKAAVENRSNSEILVR